MNSTNSIQFACRQSQCNQRLRAATSAVGKRVRCPKCQGANVVPLSEEECEPAEGSVHSPSSWAWFVGAGTLLAVICGIAVCLWNEADEPRRAPLVGEIATATRTDGLRAGEAEADESQTEGTGGFRQETVMVRLAENVGVNRIRVTFKGGTQGRIVSKGNGRFSITGDKGHVFGSDGLYLVSGSVERQSVSGGVLELLIRVGPGESSEDIRSDIERLLNRCAMIEYLESPAVVHGVFSPLHMEMVTDDEPAQIDGIVGISVAAAQQLDDSEFRAIARLTHLKRLFLARTELSDAHLAHLRHMTHLRVLNLSETKVTNDGASHLANLTGLRAIDLSGTDVTKPALEQLQNAVQDALIKDEA